MPDRDKYLRTLRELGRPYMRDAGPTRKRLLILYHRHQMSYRQIASAADLHKSHVGDLISGRIITVTPETATKVAAVRPPAATTDDERLRGRRDPAEGTKRRLDAMALEGWTYIALGELCGISLRGFTVIASGGHRTTTPAIAAAVQGAYARTASLTPTTHGVGERQQGIAVRAAVRRGAAPRHCWDDDTIDEPSAIPEWTGMCGTREGYLIHQREEGRAHWKWTTEEKRQGVWVVGCPPCRKANAENVQRLRMSRASTDDRVTARST